MRPGHLHVVPGANAPFCPHVAVSNLAPVFFFGTDVLTVTHKTAARCCLHSAPVVGSFCLAVEKMKSQDVVWNLVLLAVWTTGCKLCFQQLYESKDHSEVVIKNSGTSTRGGVKECVGVKK